MMSFDFDKLQSKDIAVAVVVYGGPQISYEYLSFFQQNLFLNNMFELNLRDFENYITQHTDPRDWYAQYVHHTSISVPIWIAIAYGGSIVFNRPILSSADMAAEVSDIVRHTNLYVYSNKDAYLFNRYLRNEKAKGKIIEGNDLSVRSFQEISNPNFIFDTLDEHLSYIDYPTGEFITAPHYLMVNAPERIKNTLEEKVLSFWKLTQIA
jgi:hypothetical protein